ncbi:ATP-binding cassette, subfamily B, MsbA [Seinonella peptonophila]|uniref:ATP-binding cassette, subfamily B, MsbA n=1 Tax=Seinonella peptonophila TaxID=112248 RepID=A0A1M4ZIB3_9BACL|nr:ABC transporter ATP-binding protein [Seinonella peptonophila]SHF17789.1 ATP-binding cassette, subfamily B, MsbA [Seinonella peptonophila]
MGTSFQRYMRFVKPYRGRLILTVFIGMLRFGIPLLLPLILKYIVDDILMVSLPLETKLYRLGLIVGVTLLIFTVVRIPVEYYRQYFAQWIAYHALYDIRNRLFEHMQKLSLRYYENNRVGQIVSRVINDVEQTKDFIIVGLMNIWLDTAMLIIAICIMCWMHPMMTVVSLSIFPLYIICMKYFYKNMKHFTKERSQALGDLQGHLHERTQGMPVIRAFHLEKAEQEQFEKRNQHFLSRAVIQSRWVAKTFTSFATITDLAPLIAVTFAAYLVIKGQMTLGEMTAFYGYMSIVYAPIRRLVNASTSLTQAHASMDRVFEFLDETYDIMNKPDAEIVDDVVGQVEFHHVWFNYHEGQKPVLRDIHFTVEPGQTVAIVGPSGGGKSTLISLLPRFYDVTKGEIRIDGRSITSFTLGSLRQKMGFVLQEQLLFSGTVEENLRMGKLDATLDEIVEAAKLANAHSFITELPDGYQTEIGERGIKLSGGQKQRLSLARVFLKNPSILILDEATSHLDLKSEQLVQESIERLKKGRTTIVIAHRLSTITHADQIYYVERGELKEHGTHQELMKKNGMYAQLYRVQNLTISSEVHQG